MTKEQIQAKQSLDIFNKQNAQAKAIVEDNNTAEINGRKYQLSLMTHKDRLPFLQYYEDMLPSGTKEKMDFEKLEGMLSNYVLFDNSLLSNLTQHWDKFPQDYKPFINTMFKVVLYPFLCEEWSSLAGLSTIKDLTTSKKQI